MEVLSFISAWMLPVILLTIIVTATLKKVPAYDHFVEGGKEGISIAVSIIPFLVGMMVSIAIFRASGMMDLLIRLIAPVFEWLHIPTEVAPVAMVRPISGNAALGITNDLLKVHGADSLIGKMASAIHASSDTTFYVLTVYFGAIRMRKMGDSVKIALIGDVIGIIAAIGLAVYFWG